VIVANIDFKVLAFLTVCLRLGCEVGATSSLAPKIGPLGLVRIYRWF